MTTTKTPIKILLANSYDFKKIYNNWENKINPSHFLMGKIELDDYDDFLVDILPFEKYNWLNKLGHFLKIPNLDQQIRILLSLSRYDVLYFPYPLSNSRLIMFLKFIGFLKTPAVILAHQSYAGSSLTNRVLLKSFMKKNYIAFLSENLMKNTIEYLSVDPQVAKRGLKTVNWGPDTVFYRDVLNDISLVNSDFAVCAGTINRDFDMLIQAFTGLKSNLKIFCTPSNYSNKLSIPENVTIDNSWIAYTELLKEYRNAAFIIIPIKEEVKNQGDTFGLTVLLDAVAIGKPVLMTYHPYIDLDIEAENIGMWVRDNTVSGWKTKLIEMFEKKDQYETMRINALNLYKTRVNADIFATEMAEIFRKAAGK
jgi:glycosyltransferase involved in cell wall biosynthesis